MTITDGQVAARSEPTLHSPRRQRWSLDGREWMAAPSIPHALRDGEVLGVRLLTYLTKTNLLG